MRIDTTARVHRSEYEVAARSADDLNLSSCVGCQPIKMKNGEIKEVSDIPLSNELVHFEVLGREGKHVVISKNGSAT